MQSQDLVKIVVNTCVNDFHNKELMNQISADLAMITGQRPILIKAKKSIATFKVREGQSIAFKVTLRRKRMRDFFVRLVGVVLPRVKDFRGIELKSFDGQGNLTIGIREHTVFPEINPESSPSIFSLEVTIVTKAKEDAGGQKILKELGFPLINAQTSANN